MTKKHWKLGRLHVLVGVSHKWGVELTLDTYEWAIAMHVLNAWVVFEWWPKEVADYPVG